MEIEKKVRESNFELMRIISMFMIVAWHVIICGVGLTYIRETLALSFDVIKAIFVVHVNSFVLITGYFQSNSKFSLKKVWNLIATSWFYRIVAVIVALALSLTTLTNLEILNNIFILPLGHEHWFIHYYILLYLVSPFLNKLISSVKQDEYKKLILTLIFIDCFLPYLTNQQFFSAASGFSLIHFVTLYFIGGYLRKYPLKDSYHFKNMSLKKFRLTMVVVFFACAFFSVTILYLGRYICNISNGDGSILFEIGRVLQSHAGTYDYPLTVLQSCAYLLFFSTFSFKNKLINKISSLMIGVYLIHESELLKPYLYQAFAFDAVNNSNLVILGQVFLLAVFIFVSATLIEFVRKEIVIFLKFILKRIRRKNSEIT